MLEIEEAFNILEEEYKKQKILLNKIHTIKEYLFDLEADLEEEKAENNEKAEIIKKAIEYINEMCLCSYGYANYGDDLKPEHIVDILRGEDNE